jgi:glycerophosphoryl diester phosphodiesterase
VLDLKGRRRTLAERVLESIGPYLGARRFTVCARTWHLLEAFSGTPVRSVHSVGTARQLHAILRRFAGQRLQGISIHERLLDAHSVAAVRTVADTIMTWPVNRPERARELLGLGVDGLITDDAAAIAYASVLRRTA